VISLIAKIKGDDSLKYYRLIVVTNFKILANRLAIVAAGIISPN